MPLHPPPPAARHPPPPRGEGEILCGGGGETISRIGRGPLPVTPSFWPLGSTTPSNCPPWPPVFSGWMSTLTTSPALTESGFQPSFTLCPVPCISSEYSIALPA